MRLLLCCAAFGALGLTEPGAAAAEGGSKLRCASVRPEHGNAALLKRMAALELARSRAIATGDTRFLDRIYRDDFKGVAGNGAEVDKPMLFALFARVDDAVSFVPDRFAVTAVGRSGAAVRGRLTGRDPSGRIVTQSVFLHVYQRVGCDWQMVTGQSTPIPEDRYGD